MQQCGLSLNHQLALELSSSISFSTLVYDLDQSGTTFTIPTPLDALTTYYWRVSTSNVCGNSVTSGIFSFTTLDQPAYFSELFGSTNANDMDNIQIILTPDGTPDDYEVSDLSIPGDCIDPEPPCPADLSNDQMVDQDDIAAFWPMWTIRDPAADVNLDLHVDILDVLTIESLMGTCPAATKQ